AVTGTYVDSAPYFTQMHTYHLSAGWTDVVAGCNTVFFFDTDSQTSAIGTLVKGRFHQTGSAAGWKNISQVVASCDTLLVYNDAGGGGLLLPMDHGQLGAASPLYHFDAGWVITTTDDSVFFYNPQSGLSAWGT